MKQLDRYIVQHIFGFTAVVGLGLITIQALVAFVAQLDEVGRGGFSYSDLFLYTILQLPAGIYVMLPIMGMIGTLMGLGALASSSELTAMRASGVS
ncbi:MAG TPA: LptF/LptG family permease, partial [Candidatus Binatia bacterium]|nr:LptF/LptG family permease [Candidatus Binatia bacterium]